jgi:UDP-N-acetylglucosamine--N-acetylmuramyl-(pentapeptide) pyrophosphoryl-undecaprenol N-acetylglucosamine transferase
MGDALRARGHSVLYYGDPDRLEGRVASQRGYEFRSVQGPQYPRAGIVGKFRFAAALLNAILITRRKIQQDRPDMVLGVGGYIAGDHLLRDLFLISSRATSGMAGLVGSSGGGLSTV